MSLPKLLYMPIAIEIIAGLYLLLFDKLLFSMGLLHWFGLLLFILLNMILLLGSIGKLRGTERTYMGLMSGVNILGFILFVLDAALGLPFTKFNPGISLNSNIGWSYLFGFGTNAVSSFGTSLGFTVLLLTALISGISFACLSRKR
jgi:hypothetical protein